MKKNSIQFVAAEVMAMFLILAPVVSLRAQTASQITGYPNMLTYAAAVASTGTVNLCTLCPAGTYLVTAYWSVNTAFTGTSPNLITTLAWTDSEGARTKSLLGTVDTSTTNTFGNVVYPIVLTAQGTVTISGALSGTTTGNVYEQYIIDRIR